MREINSHDWRDFCQRISRQCQGAMISIELVGPDGLKTERAHDLTLEDIVFDTQDPCSDMILVRARNTREITYDIIDPIYIRLRESTSGNDFNPVQIEAESGITFLTLHPAIHAQMLEGLKIT
jgi:hypothetical protein